ncbi:MAG: amidohydrolase family protein [Pseudomonadota bacterium]|nr:amidohydrolase family protein [Pseudomonadota bacterium]
MAYIDADSHVYEVEETWDYLPKKYRDRRPVAVTISPKDAPYMGVDNSFWLVDGKAMQWTWGPGTIQIGCPLTSVHAGMKEFSVGNQSLMDVPARLADMDRAGVDVQVIYPTLLFAPMTDDDDFQAALEISYNKWIEERCSEAPGRLKWSASLPLRNPKMAEKEVFRVKDAGAVSLMCYGTVNDTMLHHPKFDRVWAAAAECNLPIAIHVGWPGPLRQMCDEHSSSLNVSFTLPLLIGFYSFVGGGVLDRHPKLRSIFLEGGAGWVPWYLERMDHYYPVAEFFRGSFGLEPITSKNPESYMDRIFTTCEAGERLLPQVIDYLGEDNIMVSEDMPHLEAREGSGDDLSARRDISKRQREKILFDNPSKFYGIKVKKKKVKKK